MAGSFSCPSGALKPGFRYEPCAMEIGDTPGPVQMADMRSRSVSKHAQQSFPRLSTIPRGVRLFEETSEFRASSTVEKNGKFVSTKPGNVGSPGLAGPGSSAVKAGSGRAQT